MENKSVRSVFLRYINHDTTFMASKKYHFSPFSLAIKTTLNTNKKNENDVIPIKMPSMSPTMQQGNIVKWHKQEGDTVAAGDVLCEIQTDKAVIALETDDEGILAKILKPDDSKDVKINSLIALMVEEGDDWQSVEVPADFATPDVASSDDGATEKTTTPQASPGTHGSYGPAVRSILDVYGLEATDVAGTGPHGRLLKGDLLDYIKKKGLKPASPQPIPLPPGAASKPVAAPVSQQEPTAPVSSSPASTPTTLAPDGSYEDIPLTNMRSVIAKRLTQSKMGTPHAYATIKCKVDNIFKLRKDLKADGIKVSVNDFIIKACAVALQQVPEVNAQWTGETSRLLSNIDISVAVATESGLITPIVKDAIGLGVEEISQAVKELAGRAREGKLQPEEFMGGTFTISNLGMFGITHFTAIINPPQAAILAVGGSQMTFDPETEEPCNVMTLTLCADGRIVDEAIAAKFAEVLQEVLENPMLMLSHRPTVSLDKLFAKP